MRRPNIKMVRVDERLIHRQGQLWIKSLGMNLVIYTNGRTAEGSLQQMPAKTVVPKGTSIRFWTIEHTAKVIWEATPSQAVFTVVGDLHDALELCKLGFPAEQLNIRSVHTDEGKGKISRFIYLGKEDKQAPCLMRDSYGVTFNTKTSPLLNDGSQYLDVLMEKISN